MKKIIIAIFALCLLNSCNKEVLDVSSDEFNSSEMKRSVDPKTEGVTIPFKSNFYTEQQGLIDMDACEGDFIGLNTQVGGGNATHLGKFKTRMEFCMNFNDTSPKFGEYWAVDGKFIAANGDELYFTVSGQVLMYPEGFDPFYVAYFDDPFTFTGGTGRFVGATGSGYTNSLTNFAHTDHNWTGTLTLLKGK